MNNEVLRSMVTDDMLPEPMQFAPDRGCFCYEVEGGFASLSPEVAELAIIGHLVKRLAESDWGTVLVEAKNKGFERFIESGNELFCLLAANKDLQGAPRP